MKGAQELLNVLLVVIILGLFASFLFYNTMSGRRKATESLGITYNTIELKDILDGFYYLHYPVVIERNEEFINVIRYACLYGEGPEKEYVVASNPPIIFFPKAFTESYLNDKLIKNYYFEVECENKTFVVGKPPENKETVVSNMVMIPLPRGGMAYGKLQIW